MLDGIETIATIADHWLAQFKRALAEPDNILLKTLFHPDSHWRDVLALTWYIRTVNGLNAIIGELKAHSGRGSGVLRLTPDADNGKTFKAWTLLTALDELKGFEERVGVSEEKVKG